MKGSYRWQHKGDDRFICDDNWGIIIHPALQAALSINNKQDKVIERKKPVEGDLVNVKFESIHDQFAFGRFVYKKIKYKAFLHISEIVDEYVKDIHGYINCENTYRATLLRYNDEHRNWIISIKQTKG